MTVVSFLGLAVALAALLLTALVWVEKRRSDRDQEATDELMMNYLLLVARGEGLRVDAGMMKRHVPGFGDDSPMPVDPSGNRHGTSRAIRHRGRNTSFDATRFGPD